MTLGHPPCISDLNFLSTPGEEYASLSVQTCIFTSENTKTSVFSEYGLELPQSLERAVQSRQIEFLVGRYLAMSLLKNANADSLVVGRGESSQPIWPKGFTGSISHTENSAICALGNTKDFQSVGVDIERYMTQKQILEIGSRIACSREIELAKRLPLPQEQFFSLLFSAKESVFKALFPLVNRYFEFSDVELVGVDVIAGKFEVLLAKSLAQELNIATNMRGKFRPLNTSVITLVSLPA